MFKLSKKEILLDSVHKSIDNYFDSLYETLKDKDAHIVFKTEDGNEKDYPFNEFNIPFVMTNILLAVNGYKDMYLNGEDGRLDITRNNLYSVEIILKKEGM